MVDTRPRQQTLLDRFEELDAIWPEVSAHDRVLTTSLGRDDILAGADAPGFVSRHRWGLIALATVVAAAAWLVLVAAPGLESRLADETRAGYDGALASIDLAVPDARRALAVLTDPASDAAELSSSLERLNPFVSATSQARAVVAEPLPATPPLVPRDKIEALISARAVAGDVVNQSEAIAARLNTLLTYRLLAASLFELPALPFTATTEDTDLLSVDLAGSLAASVEIAVSLPSDPLLNDHRRLASEALVRIEGWRSDYLAALRAEDAAAAEAAVDQITAAIGDLDASLQASLGDIESWGARELDLLRLATLDGRSG